MLNDMELVKLAVSDEEGSVEAKEELLNRCKDVLSFHIVKYKNTHFGRLNKFDIEDLISECHLAVLESIELYDPEKHRNSGFSNFAKFIIKNRIIDLFRRRITQNRVINFAVDISTVDAIAPERVKEQIDLPGMSERNKLLIAMLLDGYTQVEVGQKFGMSKHGVNKILKRYIKK